MDARLAAELPARRERLSGLLETAGVDAVFLPPSSDLEYLTGLERDLPPFGEISYAHGWVAGALLAPGREPLFVLPRMVVDFHLGGVPPEGATVVGETDHGERLFYDAAASLGTIRRLGVGARTWARTVLELQTALHGVELLDASALVGRLRRAKSPLELELMGGACRAVEAAVAAATPRVVPGATVLDLLEEVEHALRRHGSRCPSFPTHVFTYGPRAKDSGDSTATERLAEGEVVMFDAGGVLSGYCSDYGRTVPVGEPPAGYEEVVAVLLAAQEAGRAALVPGATAAEVNAACRTPIEEAGLGDAFRHRMGHGIGLDVHEPPFLSPEDATPLAAGMTFTDEPSLLLDDRFGVRVEDVITCAEGGGRPLGDAPGFP
jgi:Xaa-Pro aminopeptidase